MSILSRITKKLKSSEHSDNSQTTVIEPAQNWHEAARRWELLVQQRPDDPHAQLKLFTAIVAIRSEEEINQKILDLQTKFPDTEAVHLEIARYYLNKKIYLQALEKWQKINETNPTNAEALNALGHIHLRMDETDQAFYYADKMVELQGHALNEIKLRARIYTHTNEWQSVIDCIESFSNGDNLDTDCNYLLAGAYFKTSRFEEAIDVLESNFPADTGAPNILQMKQQLLMKMESWQEALKTNDLLLSVKSEELQVLRDRAVILFKMDRLEEADKICQGALKKSEGNLSFLTLYAQIGQAMASKKMLA